MFANPVELHVLAIEPETCLGIEAERAESGVGPHLIDHFSTYQHLRAYLIDIGVIDRPQMGTAHFQTNCSSLGIKHLVAHLIGFALTFHIGSHGDTSVGIGNHMHPPVFHMHIGGFGKPHMAVDTASAIPSGIRLIAIIHTHSHHVATGYEIRCDVVFKRAITVRAVAHFLTVDIDTGIHIHSVELNEVAFSLFFLQIESLAIPSNAARKCSPTRS